ncbi:MAG: PAS domain S-box protein [Candidatus Hodarchaeota archaeon]
MDIIDLLLVDDDERFLELSIGYLSNINKHLKIDTCLSARAALQKLESQSYDAIVSDYDMPEINGLKLLATLRKRGDRIPFIILTGKSREEVVIEALNLGADYYLQKGSDFKSLFTELVNIIEKEAETKWEREKRELAEKARMESEKQYRSFLQNFPGIAFQGRMDFTPIFFHGRVEAITGYTETEFTNAAPRWDQIIHQDDFARISRSLKNIALIPNFCDRREYRIIRKDGQVRWVHEIIQNLCDDSETPILVQGTIYDITDRKQMEEKLQQQTQLRNSEHKYRSIIEQAFDGISLTDEHGVLIEWNPGLERMTGLTAGEVLGRPTWDVLIDLMPKDRQSPQHLERLKMMVLDLLKTGRASWIYNLTDIVFVHRNGTQRFAQYMTFPISTPKGFMIASFIRDITDQRRKDEKIKTQEEETKLFLDIISHDLKNYLTASKGYLDLILEESNGSQITTQASLLQNLRTTVVQGITLLTNMSVLMKQQSSFFYELQPVNLGSVVDKLRNTLQDLFPLKQIEVIKTNIPLNFYFMVDSLFEHLLLNLLTNAVKNDVHEVVQIEIAIETNDGQKNTAILSVTDYGRGIPPVQRPGLFDRFTEFRKKGKGSGLGLFIVKTLVERYGGQIWIENRVADDYTQGTKFKMRLRLP